MLGTYQSFPENVQRVAYFMSSVSYKKLQRAMIEAFCTLNAENLRLEDVGNFSMPDCRIIFEFGIAEAQTFNYLDDEEKRRLIDCIGGRPFQIMDFLCALRYHRMREGKAAPLRFDYYILRFIFDKELIEVRVFHERGSMHMAPAELVDFLYGKVNGMFSRKALKAVEAS